jgi:hypothetical protein
MLMEWIRPWPAPEMRCMSKKEEIMRTRIFLALMLCSLALRLQAEDLKPPPEVRRLEYIHYRVGGHMVNWGVSTGTVNDNGDYVPTGDPLESYSLDLETGDMTRDGEHAMSTDDADSATLVFQGLSRLLATYTDGMDATTDMDSEESGKTGPGDSAKAGANSAKQSVQHRHQPPAGRPVRKNESLARGEIRQPSQAVALAAVVHQ